MTVSREEIQLSFCHRYGNERSSVPSELGTREGKQVSSRAPSLHDSRNLKGPERLRQSQRNTDSNVYCERTSSQLNVPSPTHMGQENIH